MILLVGDHEIDPDDSDGWGHDDPRKDAAVRLRQLIPARPDSQIERVFIDPGQGSRTQDDLHEAADTIGDLIGRMGAFDERSRPWPTLATIERLVDDLVMARTIDDWIINGMSEGSIERAGQDHVKTWQVQAPEATGPTLMNEPAADVVILGPAPVPPVRGGRNPAAFDEAVAEATFRQLRGRLGRIPQAGEVYHALPDPERKRGSENTFRGQRYFAKWVRQPGWGSSATPGADTSAVALPDALPDGIKS